MRRQNWFIVVLFAAFVISYAVAYLNSPFREPSYDPWTPATASEPVETEVEK